MAWLENVIFKNQVIENERLELTDKGSLYYLSSNLVLRNCTVVLKVSARNLIINGATFIDCSFEVKQELKNHQQWISASLEGCRFKGRFSGCDFGSWPDYPGAWKHGSIKDCDFTEARLDGCRFMGCNPSMLRFPRWPCFTLVDPIGRAPELRRAEWPRLFGRIVVDELHNQPPPTQALVYHAPSIARELETTPEELRAVIERFDFILH